MNQHKSQSGVALILVLWVSVLLTVIASSFAYATRTDMGVLANQNARALAAAAADAGVHRAIAETYRPFPVPYGWKQDGMTHEFDFGEARVRVSMADESAKIDINDGSPLLLKGLFLSQGLSDADSNQLADAIQDWRDPDSLVRPNGAEEDYYREAGLPQRPPNSPFQTIEELRLVRGMTPELFRRIEPMITIYSRQAGINLATASRAVLMSIPEISAAQVDAYVAAREAARLALQPPPPFPPGQAFAAVPNLVGIQIISEATLGDARFERFAIVRVTRDPRRPYAFLSWKEGRTWENMNVEGAADER